MIREARYSDVEEICRVINESNYWAYKDIIPKKYFKYPIVTPSDVLRDMVRMKFFVYEFEGKIIGVAALEPRVREGIGYVRRVYVHPKYQRRGIGTMLMNYIENHAKKLGIRKLYLVVHEKAVWAINFYRKLGYRAVGYIDRPTWKDLLMEKTISSR